MFKTKTMLLLGLCIAMDIVLTRFLSIQTPLLRIGLGFMPVALAGMLYGPIAAAVSAALGDILGMLLFPTGAYFPGFTLSAAVNGALYGYCLHRRPAATWRTLLAAGLNIVLVDWLLNTLWLSIITGQAALLLFPPRLCKSLILLPIQVGLIHGLRRWLESTPHDYLSEKNIPSAADVTGHQHGGRKEEPPCL